MNSGLKVEGLVTAVHVVPFQCKIRVAAPFPIAPTAHTSLGPAAATLCSLLTGSGLGLATTLHAVPFQCIVIDVPEDVLPTAQTSFDVMAVTP